MKGVFVTGTDTGVANKGSSELVPHCWTVWQRS